MANIKVSVINASTVLTDDQVTTAVPALQTQVRRDLAPAWGADADLAFVAGDGQPAPGSWWLGVLDDSDQADALGYHDLTNEGLPFGKVFARSDLQSGSEWTVTASHELLEMLVDPDVNLSVLVAEKDSGFLVLYAYEVCDPCEADNLGYKINGTLVSDFVYPAWFESFRGPGSTQFDQRKQIGEPFKLAPGGYISIFEITRGSGWTQIMAEGEAARYRMRAPIGSRRERRRTPRKQWLTSLPIEEIASRRRDYLRRVKPGTKGKAAGKAAR